MFYTQRYSSFSIEILIFALFLKGRRFEVGDIVYLIDSNLSCFYAQIRALFQDENVNAFAFLTWLLPTGVKSSTNNFQFEPSGYSIGRTRERKSFTKKEKMIHFDFRSKWRISTFVKFAFICLSCTIGLFSS